MDVRDFYLSNASVSREHFEAYVREVSKPGPCAPASYYAAVWRDAKDNAVIKQRPLPMPALAVGDEASAGRYGEALWKPVAPNLLVRSIPRAGHWLGDENPRLLPQHLWNSSVQTRSPSPPQNWGQRRGTEGRR